MIRKISIVTAMVLMMAAIPASAQAQQVDSPIYAAWARFKPGSTATLKHTMHMNGEGMNMNRTFESTSKLLEVTDEKVTIESSTKVAGHASTHQQEIPAKVDADSDKAPKLLGEETVTVEGKSYACKIYDIIMEPKGSVVHAKVWVASEVPGGIVKLESSFSHGTMKMHDEAVLSHFEAK